MEGTDEFRMLHRVSLAEFSADHRSAIETAVGIKTTNDPYREDRRTMREIPYSEFTCSLLPCWAAACCRCRPSSADATASTCSRRDRMGRPSEATVWPSLAKIHVVGTNLKGVLNVHRSELKSIRGTAGSESSTN